LLVLAVFHAATAYALNSPLLLCASLAALAGWFGIEAHIAALFDAMGSAGDLGTHAVICSVTILVWRAANHRLGGSAQFDSVFENFAANVGFWGALALCLNSGTRLAGVAILCALAAACIAKALHSNEEVFAVYGTAYTSLTLCCLEVQIIKPVLFGALLELTTIIVAAMLLWNIHRRLRAPA
jgi:hypothetical protein